MENDQKFQNLNPEPSLEMVLQSFEDYLSEVSQVVIQSMPDNENRIIAETTASALDGQLKKIHYFILENCAKFSPSQQETMQKFLRVQDGHTIAQRGTETVKAVTKRGDFGKKFLNWLIKWFGEIKKIILEIIDLIFLIFNWERPDWIDKLILILDQIFILLISFLTEVIGMDLDEFEKVASGTEVRYLNELRAFSQLRQSQRMLPL